MLKHDLMARNPLRLVDDQGATILGQGEFGAVAARAGVGKTAFLVQVALDSLLNGRNCLHIALDQPVKKVCLWYEEVFNSIIDEYRFQEGQELWDKILPHRFIMTFKSKDFNADVLEERLSDLMEQGIFYPQVCLVDGLSFDETARETLSEIKMLARQEHFPCWFTVRSSREEALDQDGLPASISQVKDLFDLVFYLAPTKSEVYIKVLKDKPERSTRLHENVLLDPSTFLIKRNE